MSIENTQWNLDVADWQRSLIQAVFDGAYYRFAGVELLELEPSCARVRLPSHETFRTPFGHVNGGAVVSLLELPSFLALVTELSEGEHAVTNDLFVQHLRGIPADAEIVLEGRLIRRGRTMAWCESQALVDGMPYSLARMTQTILPPRDVDVATAG